MSNNHDNDKIFNDYMSGNSEISRRYRNESNEEPPKHLIDATQNLIEEMMDADMEMAVNKPRKWWYVPLSLAASFVICAGVVLSILRTSDEAIVIEVPVYQSQTGPSVIAELDEEYDMEQQVMEEREVRKETKVAFEMVEKLIEEEVEIVVAKREVVLPVVSQESLNVAEQDSGLTKKMEDEIAATQEPVLMIAEAGQLVALVARDSGLTKQMEDEIKHRNKEELEQFELDSLRMVGTVEDENNLWGIIKSPDGVVHRIKVGSYMGRNTGKVLNVFEGRIEVREIVRNSQGRWEERQTGIALSDNYDAEEIKSRQK